MMNIFKSFFTIRKTRRYRRVRRPASIKSKKEYESKKELARKLVLEKLDFWKNHYMDNLNVNFIWNRVAIKNSKTRWGSCSSKKNLNFSYKIVDLDNIEQDYLIIHELCHLLQMNHGEEFWKLVSFSIPNYKEIREKMRKYNLS